MPRGKIQEWSVNEDEGKIRNDAGGPMLDFSLDDLLNPDDGPELQPGDSVQFNVDKARVAHAVSVEKA